jgi:thiamine-phosphate pyrophosphorylase
MATMRPRSPLPSAVYPITDAGAAGEAPHAELARELIRGGARWLQLRDKRAAGDLLDDYRRACGIARRSRARVIVNDRPDLALAAGAHGVHLGEEDLPAEAARQVLGPGALIGVSTHDPGAAEAASRLPVDYVALGPVYPSPTKKGPHPVLGLEGLREARLRVAGPLVAVGGIGPRELEEVLRAGADAAALISGLWRSPEGPAARLRTLLATARRALAARPLAGRHLYLVGFMGAGKSTLGPIAARALGRPFIDLDREIERREGVAIAEIFATRGEAPFRRLERAALAQVSAGREAVIALGGGALGAAGSRARVKRTGVSAWLDAPPGLLYERCQRAGAAVRPLLGDLRTFRGLYRLRRGLYAAADVRLATGGGEPGRLVERLLARLRRIR